MATTIIGVGVVSMMQLFGVLTQQNAASGHETTAMMLAGHIGEAMASLPFSDPQTGETTFGPETGETIATFDDIDDFHAQTFNPPIDTLWQPVENLAAYTQLVTVVPVYPNQPSASPPGMTTYTGAIRVTVVIAHKPPGQATAGEIYRTSWVRTDN